MRAIMSRAGGFLWRTPVFARPSMALRARKMDSEGGGGGVPDIVRRALWSDAAVQGARRQRGADWSRRLPSTKIRMRSWLHFEFAGAVHNEERSRGRARAVIGQARRCKGRPEVTKEDNKDDQRCQGRPGERGEGRARRLVQWRDRDMTHGRCSTAGRRLWGKM
jgi:hypothetical protein